jgi:hypothetical protein
VRQDERPRPSGVPLRVQLHEQSRERRAEEDGAVDAAGPEQRVELFQRGRCVGHERHVDTDDTDDWGELLEEDEEEAGAAHRPGEHHERLGSGSGVDPGPRHAVDVLGAARHIADKPRVPRLQTFAHAGSLPLTANAPAKAFVAIEGGGHFAKSGAFVDQLVSRVGPLTRAIVP